MRFVAAAMLLLVVSGRLAARPDAAVRSQDGPTIEATHTEAELRIDGRLDEAAWQGAAPATGFVQQQPVEGAPAEAPTEVRVLYDESAIYVGARLYEPVSVVDQLVRRDAGGQYDYFEVSLDPNDDQRTGYRFRVSAAGVQRDAYLYEDVRSDRAWDAVWESAVTQDSAAWIVEMRIPLSQLQYTPADTPQAWGVNFSRRRVATNEVTFFVLESRVEHGVVSMFGRLGNLELRGDVRRLELQPYALTRVRAARSEPADPLFDGMALGTQFGLDLRYGLSSAYTLDVTLNPDFGQVEVDPAVVNLSAFETFFPEKRPFFVEDAQIFDFDLLDHQDRLFHSRRIGREPHGAAPEEADFSEIPNQTTILSASKMTGRTSGGLSLGVLAAAAAEETGSAYDSATGTTHEFTVEPAAQYAVLRARRDFRDGATQIGALLTAMRRDLPDDGGFDFLTSSAFSGGIDIEHAWGGSNSRDWALSGHLAASLIEGSTTALLEVQQSSNHYFQRPDATRLSLDSTATMMTGANWQLELERQSAAHWTGSIWLGSSTPGFEINDLGFSRARENIEAGNRISYREIMPGDLFRSYDFNFFMVQSWRHAALDDPLSLDSWGHAHRSGFFSLSGDFLFLNYWGVDIDLDHSLETLSDGATRGGPLMIDPASTSIGIRAHTDRRRAIVLEPSLDYERGGRGGYEWSTELEIEVRPSSSVELSLEPEFRAELDPAQYVAATDDVGFAPTYGRRYIFADLRRRSLSASTRLNVTFSPTLTLQFFAQPLISAGDYLTYKQLEQPETFSFDAFEEGAAVPAEGGIRCRDGRTCARDGERVIDFEGDGTADFSLDDRSFNFRSLRLNAVVRWEYRPGSALFLVWQHRRADEENIGSFDPGRDLDALFGAQGENVIILKASYWMGL